MNVKPGLSEFENVVDLGQVLRYAYFVESRSVSGVKSYSISSGKRIIYV